MSSSRNGIPREHVSAALQAKSSATGTIFYLPAASFNWISNYFQKIRFIDEISGNGSLRHETGGDCPFLAAAQR